MTSTAFSNKCQILAEANDYFYGNDNYEAFFLYFDLAIPFAIGVAGGMVTANDEAVKMIEEAWIAFCDLIQIDPYGEYTDLHNMIDFASNE